MRACGETRMITEHLGMMMVLDGVHQYSVTQQCSIQQELGDRDPSLLSSMRLTVVC